MPRSGESKLSELGLPVPETQRATQINFRLAGAEARKVEAMAKETRVG